MKNNSAILLLRLCFTNHTWTKPNYKPKQILDPILTVLDLLPTQWLLDLRLWPLVKLCFLKIYFD